MLPVHSPHKSEWEPLSRKAQQDLSLVTREAEVCTISSCHKLTAKERAALGIDMKVGSVGGHEVRAHFRRGHWRRLPGYGDQPDAPKLVWVRPTLVRRDRLPRGALPGGAETILSK